MGNNYSNKIHKIKKVTITGTAMTSANTTSTENTIMVNMCYMVLVVFIVQIFLVMFVVDMSLPAKATPVILPSGNHSFEFNRYCSSALIDVIRVICDGQSNLLVHQYPNNENFTGKSNLRSLKGLIGDDSTFQKNLFAGLIHECCLRPCGQKLDIQSINEEAYLQWAFFLLMKGFQKIVPEYINLRYFITLVVSLIMICNLANNVCSHPLSARELAPNRRYCSQALFEAIRIICDGRYNSLGKKYPDSFGNFRTSTLKRLLPDDDVMYRPSYTGASSECCRRPCGYAELSSYCA